MNSKSFVARISVVATLVLGVPLNGVSSYPALEAWMHAHLPVVLAAASALMMIAIVCEASSTVDQAAEDGASLSGTSMAGTLVLATITWGVGGAVLGWTAEAWVWPWAGGYTPAYGAAAWVWIVQTGPLQVCCVVIGFLAGERLKFADDRHAAVLSVAGSIAGAAAGLVGAAYFSLVRPAVLPTGLVVPVPVLATAVVGATLAAFTAAFQPRVERDRRRSARLKEQADEKRWAQERIDADLFEHTVLRLRRMGHEVRPLQDPSPDFKTVITDLLLGSITETFNLEQKARFRKVVREGTFDETVRVLADIRVERKKSRWETEEEVRERFMKDIYSSPLHLFLKMAFNFLKPDSTPALKPPYVLVDEQNREIRITSVAALAGYADDLAREKQLPSPQV
jgi:hypothetical protein